MSKFKAKTEFNLDKIEQPLIVSDKKSNTDSDNSSINDNSTLKDKNDQKVLDFFNTNIGDLWTDLENTIKSRKPIFIWGKARQNDKITLDIEKQKLILEKIKTLRDISEEFCLLKAEAIFSEKYIQFLVANKIANAEEIFKENRALHQQRMTVINTDTKIYKSLEDKNCIEIERSRAEVDKLKAEVDKIKAESESMLIANKKQDRVVRLIDKFIDSMDFTKLSEVYQFFFATTILGGDTAQATEFDMRASLKDILVKQAEADLNKKNAEADNIKADVDAKNIRNAETKGKSGLRIV